MAAAPADPKKLLILGGTGEAAALAERLAGELRLTVVTSLAGRTKEPAKLAGAVRVGGFGGPDGLAAYLEGESVELLIDATHPFAARMAANAARACAETGVPRVKLLRPAWRAVEGDTWIEVPDVKAAAKAVGQNGRRVFLTVGRQDLAAFAGLDGVWFLVRSIEPAPCPLANCEVTQGRGPFIEADEIALLKERRIDLLVSKNSGGPATYAKIAAARGLGLPVVMIARPPAPPGDTAESVEEVVAWVTARL
ncbi:MAG: cobalt-precorrin-6A reductase [Kiloniellales bacterium]|nr:cobalt-precorrin-6A reductase [Kiloniellales bacterium]